MRKLIRMAVLAGLVYGAVRAFRKFVGMPPPEGSEGYDTPTGTDPAAKYSEPGYQDKSLGQAVNDDVDLVDRLVEEEQGDLDAAEERFRTESAGAPALAKQPKHEDA